MLLDDAMSAGWAGAVSLDPALEREFEERITDSSALAFRVALSVLRHREDAEDVAQDAFLRARRAFSGIRDRDRFRAWLVRTAFRLALDRLRGERRRTRRQDAVALETPARTDSAETDAVRGELRAHVSAAVAELPEKLRIVTVLAAIEEHDLASVARLLELPEGTVKSRLHRARTYAGGETAMACERYEDALTETAAGAAGFGRPRVAPGRLRALPGGARGAAPGRSRSSTPTCDSSSPSSRLPSSRRASGGRQPRRAETTSRPVWLQPALACGRCARCSRSRVLATSRRRHCEAKSRPPTTACRSRRLAGGAKRLLPAPEGPRAVAARPRARDCGAAASTPGRPVRAGGARSTRTRSKRCCASRRW